MFELGGARTMLNVPLLKDDEVIGFFSVYRQEVRAFSDKQIALLENFAAQAVIAMENARLLTEQREALERQTATAEVLQVINANPGNLAPVFDAMLEKAMQLGQANFGTIGTFDGARIKPVAFRGVPDAYTDYAMHNALSDAPETLVGRIRRGERIVHIKDLMATAAYLNGHPDRRALVELGGARTTLNVALRKDETVLGMIAVYRQDVRPFSERQIALLENFAAQAVIAIDNARLLDELRQRTADLQEALEFQTATSDVLKVISGSGFALEPVFQSVVETAARLCHADQAIIYRLQDGVFRWAAGTDMLPQYERIERAVAIRPGTGTVVGRAALQRRPVQILDAWTDPLYEAKDDARAGGVHTMLSVPLLHDGETAGAIGLARRRVEPYSDRQVDLVTTFADQAVIAIENARLLSELQARTEELARRQSELRITFENMGDGVAMFDETQHLIAWNGKFREIFDLPDTLLRQHRSYEEYLRFLAARGDFGTDVDTADQIHELVATTGQPYGYERTRPDGRVIEIRRNPVPDGGFVLIFSDITERKRSEEEIRSARDAAEAAFRDLKAAQASLIQAEKMASLGQLTAGIAHEIKNPLNFVNNFAELSVDLLDELNEAVGNNRQAEVEELTGTLKGNLGKIAEHGRRADGIVRGMLEHSRGSSGERRSVDLNVLVDEALNLAYHGARAQDQSFNVVIERELGDGIAPITLAPQDVTRVLLNLCGNGFYAARERQRMETISNFEPSLKVSTREQGDAVEIRVRDNGIGIPPEIRDRLFQPFFTTKPPGEGTGLGLSMSYDIITQQHGGSISLDSKVGEYSEFTVRLPRSP
jgi:signal transduction histidine kinase